ncbi:MAG: UPF0182 family protein [Candidatus Caldarchaeum sp.]|nr:UPF0182 family protein [Candidatus Caldarchaeum sp.]
MANVSRRDRRRLTSALVIILVITIFFTLFVSSFLNVWLNILEFGELFIRPFYFSLVGGLILSFIALFRLDFSSRKSIFIWTLRTFLVLMRGSFSPRLLDFERFKLSVQTFLAWQFTKVLVGTFVFSNSIFGITVLAIANGWNSGIGNIPKIFSLPFTVYARGDIGGAMAVMDASPTLILLIPPLFSAIGIRLVLLVGLTNILKVIARALLSYGETGTITIKASTLEFLASIGLAWTGFNLFFSSSIDYNTRVLIFSAFAAAAILAFYGFLDLRGKRFLNNIYLRLGLLVILGLATASVVAVQNTIADAQKIEYKGPYVLQEINVNRYLAGLDVKILQYNFSGTRVKSSEIPNIIESNKEILKRTRLWDWDAAFAKLRPEIGLIPYIDFEDSDILRFNGSLYWSASMKPVLPPTVTAADVWYNRHLVYTHIPQGFLMLDAHQGEVVDSSRFFAERRIYYGEGGPRSLFSTDWAAIVEGKETPDEIGGARYDGSGGVKVGPPISWLYDITFFLSYPDKTIHLLRYRDVHQRVQLLFPYFNYFIGNDYVDMFPVTDGRRTYWMMPLIIALPTDKTPWSNGNPYVRFVGVALIDVYDGSIQLVLLGNDFFSKLFENVYADFISREVPAWLHSQIRYPAELFEYQIRMFSLYHVNDPATFIQAREFYEIPQGVEVYYVVTKLPNGNSPEFVGLLSLELRGARGQNLAGYAVVRNDYPSLGEMYFYKVALDSPTKLLGPSAALQALQRDPDFRTLSTLLASPRIGENIFYEVGDHPVYVIPVYTAREGEGVVTQIGTIAVVGAAFTGLYYVGLGDTIEKAFANYLYKIAGETAPPPTLPTTREERLNEIRGFLRENGLGDETPEQINANIVYKVSKFNYTDETSFDKIKNELKQFLEYWKNYGAILVYWISGDSLYLGAIYQTSGVTVLRYVEVRVIG